jgi:glycosyltransferase involved in cell wall biosynthesis
MPSVSIIVCTRNRASSLSGCLNSIKHSDCPIGLKIELIVVDNGSSDTTKDVVTNWAMSSGIPTLYVYEPRKGLSVARNSGLKKISGDIIVFTDDDCRVTKTYFVDLLKHYSSDAAPVMRGGRIDLGDPDDLPLTIKTDVNLVDFAHPLHPAGFIHGANMTLAKEVFIKTGFFDEEFGAGTDFPGEDCDYVIRAHLKGFKIQYVPDMAVQHFHGRRDMQSARLLMKGYMHANGALYLKYIWRHPVLLKHLYWDILHWVKEMRGFKPFMAEAKIGHKFIIMHTIYGMFLFAKFKLRALMPNLRK